MSPSEKKSMHVLALGLSRSGTDSLKQALHILGYNDVYHGFSVPSASASERKAWVDLGRRKWGPTSSHDAQAITREDFDSILGECEAVTDQPCACFALELIKAYPEAKIILNYRDPDSWYTSIQNTFGNLFAPTNFSFHYLSPFEPSLYWLKQVFMMYEHGHYQGSMIRNARRIQREHYAMVRGAVVDKKRLLEWKVEDGWQPLCDFLKKDVPDAEFPRGNTPKEMFEKGARLRKEATRVAWRNVAIVVALFVGVVGVGYWRFIR